MKKLCFISILVATSSASYANTDRPSQYLIKSEGSTTCLDVMESSRDIGMPVQMWTCHGAANQRFEISQIGSSYAVKNVESSLCIEVPFASMADSSRVSQTICKEEDHRLFDFVEVASGVYEMKFKHSGLCATVIEPRSADGATVLQKVCEDLPSQRFQIVMWTSGR